MPSLQLPSNRRFIIANRVKREGVEVASPGLSNVELHLNNITSIRALNTTGLAANVKRSVLGHTTPGDAELPPYYWHPLSTIADNGGTVLKPNALTDAQPGRWEMLERSIVFAEWFGAFGNVFSPRDEADQIQAAIDWAATPYHGGGGAVVYFRRGIYRTSRTINIPNRVYLQGPNGRGARLVPHTGFTGQNLVFAANGTTSMFASGIRDFELDARGTNLTAVVASEAWQETCGMERCVIQFDGTTQFGILYTQGYGGAALCKFSDLEIFSQSVNAGATGIRFAQVGTGFVGVVRDCTITGVGTQQLPTAVSYDGSGVIVNNLHVEYCDRAVLLNGASSASIDTITGSFNDTKVLVSVGSSFIGSLNLDNLIPNGASSRVFEDNVSGRHIPANQGRLAHYHNGDTYADLAINALISDVTGDGSFYVIPWNNVIEDHEGEYNTTNFRVIPKREGRFRVTAGAFINVATPASTALLEINTGGGQYPLWRGDTDSIRDASNRAFLTGTRTLRVTNGQYFEIRLFVSGIGKTVDLESGGTFFTVEWVGI